MFSKASNKRNWSKDQALLPHATFKGNKVTIHNVRNIRHKSEDNYKVEHYTKTYDLTKLKSLDYILTPFGKSWFNTGGHPLLSFGFENGDYVSISVEIRKEKGEAYSAFKGFFRTYELMYVIADERDVVRLRSTVRKNQVYLYPIKIKKAVIKKVFLSTLKRANELTQKPEYYNSATNSCTSNLRRHANEVMKGSIPFSLSLWAPSFSDQFLHSMGLIKTKLPFKAARKHFNISKVAQKHAEAKNFSKKIREKL